MMNTLGLILVLLLATMTDSRTQRVGYDYFKYHPMSEISEWMTQIAKDHSDIVTEVEFRKTYELRTMSLLKIGYDTGARKKSIWMDCGIHAREWISPAFCQYFIKQILEKHKTDPKIGEILKNMDFYVVPVLNMDGYTYTWKDNTTRLWRKNRSPGSADCNCTGTDLNRNFDAEWCTLGASSDCCSIIYCGRAPLSEPESQAVAYFVGSRTDEILCFLSIHSFGQMLLVPYGHPNLAAPNYNELMDVGLAAAEAMEKVHGMKYTVGKSPDILYNYSGSSQDWAQLHGIPFSYTFELRDQGEYGFELPENQIQSTCEETYSGALHIINYVHMKTFNGAVVSAAATLWSLLLAAGVTTLI